MFHSFYIHFETSPRHYTLHLLTDPSIISLNNCHRKNETETNSDSRLTWQVIEDDGKSAFMASHRWASKTSDDADSHQGESDREKCLCRSSLAVWFLYSVFPTAAMPSRLREHVVLRDIVIKCEKKNRRWKSSLSLPLFLSSSSSFSFFAGNERCWGNLKMEEFIVEADLNNLIIRMDD